MSRRLVIGTALLGCAAIMFALSSAHDDARTALPQRARLGTEGSVDAVSALLGTRERISDIDLVYQCPSVAAGSAKGVLLLLHGCSHAATDFWPASQSCNECISLPIETAIVAASLARGWATLSVSSVDRASKCWHPARDAPRLAKAVRHARAACGLATEASPVAAIGASSGGHMASLLDMSDIDSIIGVVAQIMPSGAELSPAHLPVRFVHMLRDSRSAQLIREQVSELAAAGVDADEWQVHPTPLTVESFGARGHQTSGIAALPPDTAQAAIAALTAAGLLDARGELVSDPRRSDWRSVLRPVIPASQHDSLVADASAVSEVLNVAWAMHEFTDAYIDESLDWFEERLKAHQAGSPHARTPKAELV